MSILYFIFLLVYLIQNVKLNNYICSIFEPNIYFKLLLSSSPLQRIGSLFYPYVTVGNI